MLQVLVWEFGAPVPVKYIQDPSLHVSTDRST